MKKAVLIATAVLATSSIWAASTSFDFKDPKGVNNVVFKLDAPLESINGTATGVSGTVSVDPADFSTAKGKITVETASLTVPNPLMKEHLLGENWLNAPKNPAITFEIKEVKNVKASNGSGTADVTGTFTLNGVSKDITVPAKIAYLPGKLGDRTNGKVQGDLLVVRTSFQVNRSDYNVQPGQYQDKVSETIDLSLAIAGAAPKS